MPKVNKVRRKKTTEMDTVSFEKKITELKRIEVPSIKISQNLLNILSKFQVIEMIACAGKSPRFN